MSKGSWVLFPCQFNTLKTTSSSSQLKALLHHLHRNRRKLPNLMEISHSSSYRQINRQTDRQTDRYYVSCRISNRFERGNHLPSCQRNINKTYVSCMSQVKVASDAKIKFECYSNKNSFLLKISTVQDRNLYGNIHRCCMLSCNHIYMYLSCWDYGQ